ncbi:hypothetical protein EI541_22390, partial [Xanthomonas citri pv. eucalyptorum]
MSVSVWHAPITCNEVNQDLFGLDQDRNSHNALVLARLFPVFAAAQSVIEPFSCASRTYSDYEKPTNWTLIGDGTGHRRQMNWMRVPEALDSAASTHFSDLA